MTTTPTLGDRLRLCYTALGQIEAQRDALLERATRLNAEIRSCLAELERDKEVDKFENPEYDPTQ